MNTKLMNEIFGETDRADYIFIGLSATGKEISDSFAAPNLQRAQEKFLAAHPEVVEFELVESNAF